MKYYIIAGEASGDLHGANLMRAIRECDADARFRFWGGDAMAAVAGDPVKHIAELAIMGFVEVVGHLPAVLGNIAFCKRDIVQFAPDVVVGIDYPGFNLRIERWAHSHGYRTVHYISPNLWAWKKGRIKGMRSSLDALCCILPFERPFFAANNMPQAVYVGHPLLDAVADYKEAPLPVGADGRPIVALLPGSRRQELKKTLPLMATLAGRHPEFRFVVAGMSLVGEELYSRLAPNTDNLCVLFDRTYDILSHSYAAVVCSGTATLEAALFDVPQVVCYRANPVSVAIARTVVSRRIRYISLVNLIADKPVVTELIQRDFSLNRLEREFALITEDGDNRARMLSQYADTRALLGGGGASFRAADIIINVAK
ncbi:MAG: lipid-A-disaccharide synthase [Bacteroidales bacterium]|nr:lipid-A-disaccharide synthase [Bacteroidales bacterium]